MERKRLWAFCWFVRGARGPETEPMMSRESPEYRAEQGSSSYAARVFSFPSSSGVGWSEVLESSNSSSTR